MRAYIFGSVARGTDDTQSDVDIVMIRHTELDFFHRATELIDLVLELSPVDLLIYTPGEFAVMAESSSSICNVVEGGIVFEGQQDRGNAVARSRQG